MICECSPFAQVIVLARLHWDPHEAMDEIIMYAHCILHFRWYFELCDYSSSYAG